METTPERIAKCRLKTKMDKRSGFWQVDLTRAAQVLLAFLTPTPMILSAVPPKVEKFTKRGLSRRITCLFGFYGPRIAGEVPSSQALSDNIQTLKFGLFSGFFACSWLVLQNSAAQECTCLYRTLARNSLLFGFSGPRMGMEGCS